MADDRHEHPDDGVGDVCPLRDEGCFFAAFKQPIVPVWLLEFCLIPLAYGLIWLGIFVLAYLKDGEYNAPPSLYYIQE